MQLNHVRTRNDTSKKVIGAESTSLDEHIGKARSIDLLSRTENSLTQWKNLVFREERTRLERSPGVSLSKN